MNKLKKITALLTALFLSLTGIPCVSAADPSIEIYTEGDFLNFAEKCTRDVWSLGITANLKADLDFTDTDFHPIPVFQGTFNGNGHSIRGISWKKKGSCTGLFRTLTESAAVKNLTVEGTLYPEGSASQMGLIAGKNSGKIINCTSEGSVNGLADAGGITGINTETGTIIGCVNQAGISCPSAAGGIAGQNHGTIKSCTNLGSVNIRADQDIPTSSGGIAGNSSGMISGCINEGTIGYRHLGYNIGGIAGLLSGEIQSCTNKGPVSGRKDTGGIAGQLEPATNITYGPSPGERLDGTLSSLLEQTEHLFDQMGGMADRGNDHAKAIQTALSEIQTRTHNSITEGLDDFQILSDDLYEDSEFIRKTVEKIRIQLQILDSAAQSDIPEMLNQISILRNSLSDLLENVGSELDESVRQLDILISRTEAQTEILRIHLTTLKNELDALKTFADTVIQLVKDGNLNSGTMPDLPDTDIPAHLEAIFNASGQISQNLRAFLNQWINIYNRYSPKFKNELDSANTAADNLNNAADHLVSAQSGFSDEVFPLLADLNDTVEHTGKILKNYSDSLNDKAHSTSQDVNEQLTIIQDRVKMVNEGFGSSHEDIKATANKIFDLLDELRISVREIGEKPELTISDESIEITEGPGTISDCHSAGTIIGDSNTGGIAGTVSTELASESEETFQLEDMELLADAYATLHAVIRSCRFDGEVIVKNESGGGIAGRCEVGAIYDCTARGSVSAGTNYCGGIAGRTKGIIRQCAALVDLTGESWVGGIAGSGKKISDCRAMVSAESDGECVGAIAGESDETLTKNYYLEENLAGMDGVDYAESAQGLPFCEFSKLDHIPKDFLTFSYLYRIDGKVVGEVFFSYGGNLDTSGIPKIPRRENGQFGVWPDHPTRNLKRSMILDAIFTDPSSTLSSGGDIPDLLVQGHFPPDAYLNVSRTSLSSHLSENETPSGAWEYALMNGNSDQILLRLHVTGTEIPVVYLEQNGILTPAEITMDGSYAVFKGPSAGKILLMEKNKLPIWIPIGIAAGIVLIAGIIGIIGWKIHKKSRKKNYPEREI